LANPNERLLALVLGVLVLAWLALSLYVLVTRTLHDAEQAALRRVQRSAGTLHLLRRLPRRSVERVAADAATPDEFAAVLSAWAVRDDPARVVADAYRSGKRRRWRRIAALRILTRVRWNLAPVLLERALESDDEVVVTVAVGALGELGDAHSSNLLVDALRHGRSSRSRIATQLDQAPGCSPDLLLPLLLDPDAVVRFWGATLLARHARDDDVARELAVATGDAAPSVRAAAVEGLAASGASRAPLAVRRLLADPVWYVRVHALRSLGLLGLDELLPDAAALLADESWWVRAAAKEALERRPVRAAELLMDYLEHPDAFARNGAAETLQNIGVLDELVAQARVDPSETQLLARILQAGGARLTASAAIRGGLDAARLEELADNLAAAS
jgi:HEAT repeat protein